MHIDDHVEVDGDYYSVPYSLVKQQLGVRRSAQVVEIFHKGTRVASHQRSPLKGRHTTVTVPYPRHTNTKWNGPRNGSCSGGAHARGDSPSR